jgi:hypothetical protein
MSSRPHMLQVEGLEGAVGQLSHARSRDQIAMCVCVLARGPHVHHTHLDSIAEECLEALEVTSPVSRNSVQPRVITHATPKSLRP